MLKLENYHLVVLMDWVLLAQRQEILLEVLVLDDYGNVYVLGMTKDGNNFGIFPNVFGNPGQ